MKRISPLLSLIFLLTLTFNFLNVTPAQAAPPYAKIYVVNTTNDTVSVANIDGSGGVSLGTLGGLLSTDPNNIALDVTRNMMYIAERSGNRVIMANLDGSSPTVLTLGGLLNAPYTIALDLLNSKMYVPNMGNSTIIRANLDGSGAVSLGNLGGLANQPFSIALDPLHHKLYVGNYTGKNIIRANLDGTGAVSLGTLGGDNPYGIALDVPNNRMYVTSLVSNTVIRANLDGTSATNLGNPGGFLNGAYGIALDAPNNRMYITSIWNGVVVQADLNGGSAVSLGNLNGTTSGVSGIALSYPTLLSDSFISGSQINDNLASRQTGSRATQTYTATYPAWCTVNAASGRLECLDVFTPDYNFDNTAGDSAGGIHLSTRVYLAQTGVDNWMCMTIGASSGNRQTFPATIGSPFWNCFRESGKFFANNDGSTISSPVYPNEPNWASPTGNFANAWHTFDVYARDISDGDPFDGAGNTEIFVFADGNFVWSYNLTSGLADNYVSIWDGGGSSIRYYHDTISVSQGDAMPCLPTVTVVNTNDNESGSLRQAIADVCPGGTITFDNALSGQTIRLASRLILDKNMTIDGSSLASSVIISGDTNGDTIQDVQIFYIEDGNAGIQSVVTLRSLTLTRGMGDSTLWGAPVAGAIHNAETLYLYNSTITNHTAANAGAIANAGTATIVNSTFSGNSATGAAPWLGYGGAIYNAHTLTILNSTFSSNTTTTAGADIYNNDSLALGATLNYANTIIANSTGATSCENAVGTIGTNTNNLVEGTTNCAPMYTSGSNLAALGPNGGPTETFALQTGSSAINTGDAATCANAAVNNLDQRGTSRPQGVTCDIGSYEYVFTIAEVDPGAAGGNGPGGVGTGDGSSSLEAWFRADRGVYMNAGCSTAATNGDSVACWKDQSGNNVNATPGTGAPTYNTNLFNNQPALTFDGSASELLLNRVVQDDFTIISLFRTTQSYDSGVGFTHWWTGAGLVDAEAPGWVYDFGMSLRFGQLTTGTGGGSFGNDVTLTSALTYNDNAGHMAFFHRTQDTGDLQQYVDGNQTGTGAGTTTSLTSPDGITIGAIHGHSGYFLGSIPEAIIFSTNLPDVDRILVENYLSAKYNVVLGANDVYDGDTAYDFDLDMAGIGLFGGNSHPQAFSAGMIIVNRSFVQDDGDWLTFGHRTASNSKVATELPNTGDWESAPNPMRWGRHWYFDLTDVGTPGGTVDIIFDFSEGGMNGGQPPVGPASNYRLLRRGNSDTDFSDIATASAIIGDQVQFIGVPISLLGSNFTLGTLDDDTSPTAIELNSLSASPLAASPWLLFAATGLLLGLAGAFVLRRR